MPAAKPAPPETIRCAVAPGILSSPILSFRSRRARQARSPPALQVFVQMKMSATPALQLNSAPLAPHPPARSSKKTACAASSRTAPPEDRTPRSLLPRFARRLRLLPFPLLLPPPASTSIPALSLLRFPLPRQSRPRPLLHRPRP